VRGSSFRLSLASLEFAADGPTSERAPLEARTTSGLQKAMATLGLPGASSDLQRGDHKSEGYPSIRKDGQRCC